MVYYTRRFVVCLSVCHFVLVFFSPFSIAITSLGEERANLHAFRTFVRFVLVWICRFPLPLGVWEGLWFVIVALPGLFSYLFLLTTSLHILSPETKNYPSWLSGRERMTMNLLYVFHIIWKGSLVVLVTFRCIFIANNAIVVIELVEEYLMQILDFHKRKELGRLFKASLA